MKPSITIDNFLNRTTLLLLTMILKEISVQ
uniref:Uncharacterized protein n=1 Tax=Lepeophtheirus salmonis TaxID=72036 RepID=A0A0K2U103_LEPSM